MFRSSPKSASTSNEITSSSSESAPNKMITAPSNLLPVNVASFESPVRQSRPSPVRTALTPRTPTATSAISPTPAALSLSATSSTSSPTTSATTFSSALPASSATTASVSTTSTDSVLAAATTAFTSSLDCPLYLFAAEESNTIGGPSSSTTTAPTVAISMSTTGTSPQRRRVSTLSAATVREQHNNSTSRQHYQYHPSPTAAPSPTATLSSLLPNTAASSSSSPKKSHQSPSKLKSAAPGYSALASPKSISSETTASSKNSKLLPPPPSSPSRYSPRRGSLASATSAGSRSPATNASSSAGRRLRTALPTISVEDDNDVEHSTRGTGSKNSDIAVPLPTSPPRHSLGHASDKKQLHARTGCRRTSLSHASSDIAETTAVVEHTKPLATSTSTATTTTTTAATATYRIRRQRFHRSSSVGTNITGSSSRNITGTSSRNLVAGEAKADEAMPDRSSSNNGNAPVTEKDNEDETEDSATTLISSPRLLRRSRFSRSSSVASQLGKTSSHNTAMESTAEGVPSTKHKSRPLQARLDRSSSVANRLGQMESSRALEARKKSGTDKGPAESTETEASTLTPPLGTRPSSIRPRHRFHRSSSVSSQLGQPLPFDGAAALKVHGKNSRSKRDDDDAVLATASTDESSTNRSLSPVRPRDTDPSNGLLTTTGLLPSSTTKLLSSATTSTTTSKQRLRRHRFRSSPSGTAPTLTAAPSSPRRNNISTASDIKAEGGLIKDAPEPAKAALTVSALKW